MKKHVLLACIPVLFLSCPMNPGGKGSLALGVEPYPLSGLVLPRIPLDPVALTADCRSSSGETLSLRSEDVERISVTDLPAGTWDVTVRAETIAGTALFGGSSRFRVDPGKTVSGTIALAPLPGKGTIALEIDTPDGVVPERITVVGDSPGAVLSVVWEPSGGTYSGEQDSGLHEIAVNIAEAASLDASYRVLVLPGVTTRVAYPPSAGLGTIPGGGTGNPRHEPVDLGLAAAIIADHTAVDASNRIPDAFLRQVRRQLLSIPGESHVRGFLYGMELLERENPKFAADTVWQGAPGPDRGNLRVSRTYWYGLSGRDRWDVTVGEQDTWTHAEAVKRMIGNLDHHKLGKAEGGIGRPVSVFGWMWCWDMFELNWDERSGWAGRLFTSFYRTDHAPQVGSWELSSPNEVSLEDYFYAMEAAAEAAPGTIVMYVTGPVDRGGNTGGPGYQRLLKNDRIRSYVTENRKVLFDYEDILSWDYAGGKRVTDTWNGREYPVIAPDCAGEYAGEPGITREDSCHVSRAGALRLARAAWWLMARLAGWQG